MPLALEASIVAVEKRDYNVLMSLVSKLTKTFLPQVLETLEEFNQEERAYILCILAGRFPEVLPQALEAVQVQLELSGYLNIEAFNSLYLTELMPDNLLINALELTARIDEVSLRIEAYNTIIPRLIRSKNKLNLWKNLLHFLSKRSRSGLLQELAIFTPLIFAIGGIPALRETSEAINKVTKWWN
ncbi:hypothetical protein IQ264_25270 [Phormidium sp. LEGE 05292]|uniref:hypothetical protein n=1 Tax=[Phormidium] sp. LEGE 05292 TaxID=767427 RepID=UPI00187E58B7|nr:hypothetical protein [Phormidium sp. LEGE 05292]MBE9228725.1 hypothetical protein [Phormidium sp. LEGE 05292]